MSWILMLLKNLPALMAALQAIIAIFTAKAAVANHAAYQASVAAGQVMGASAAADWNWYVAGQGGGAAALGVSAVAFACAQPTLNRVFEAFRREEASVAAALSQVVTSRDGAAAAFALRSQMLALSAEHRKIVIGD